MPFDILSGDSGIRETLIQRGDLTDEKKRWDHEIKVFRAEFREFSLYDE